MDVDHFCSAACLTFFWLEELGNLFVRILLGLESWDCLYEILKTF